MVEWITILIIMVTTLFVFVEGRKSYNSQEFTILGYLRVSMAPYVQVERVKIIKNVVYYFIIFAKYLLRN